MKPSTEMVEGTEAWDRFNKAMKKIIAVPDTEVQRRIEQHKRESLLNPHRRGPKPKAK